MSIKHPFPPFYDKDSRVLILGSFPSIKSREQNFFYGHPQNRFWKVLAGLLSEITPQTVEEKREFLHLNHVALWDVIESCDIEGSSDSSIRNVIPNNLTEIFETADIRAVYCNGTASYEYYKKYQEEKTGRKAVKLPSTSPANAAFSLDKLKEYWKVICGPLGVAPAGIGDILLRWYDYNARILPWRSDPTPYHVWVSEIMLQQTRVEAVKQYYVRWMEVLPDIKSLAEVDDDTLMKLWEGLGYYNRVRNLKTAAITVMEEHQGELPTSVGELLKLKGIGEYTAGAIASIAFGQPESAVDGNVLRVFSRLLAEEGDIHTSSVKKRIDREVRRIMPQKRPGDFNQALMDLGSGICLPNGEPLCEQCPWEAVCQAHKRNQEIAFPVRAEKKSRRIEKKVVFLIEIAGQIESTGQTELIGPTESAGRAKSASQIESTGQTELIDQIESTGLIVSDSQMETDSQMDRDSQVESDSRVESDSQAEMMSAIILHKRPKKGLLPDLWEYPNLDGDFTQEMAENKVKEWFEGTDFVIEKVEPAGKKKHIFSHVEWHMVGYHFHLKTNSEGHVVDEIVWSRAIQETLRRHQWVTVSKKAASEQYAIPSVFAYYKEQM